MREIEILHKLQNSWSHLHLIHIENMTVNGVPDINFCHEGTEVWLELKVMRGDHIYMEKFQPQFHLLRNARGGNCFIFAARHDIIKVLRLSQPVQIARSEDVGKFKKFRIDDLELVIEWQRPFKWPYMFKEMMERIRCLRTT